MPIRPALETLRVLDNENFMDKLALAIHDVSNSVRALGKAGKITVDLTVAPLSKSGLVEQAFKDLWTQIATATKAPCLHGTPD